MGPMVGLDRCGESHPPTGIRSPDRPARSESLYRLSCPGPPFVVYTRDEKEELNACVVWDSSQLAYLHFN